MNTAAGIGYCAFSNDEYPVPVTPSENKSTQVFQQHDLPPTRRPTIRGINSDQEAMMPTQLKSETARANGAKSQGPKTAQGREISSRNSTKHGLSSRNLLVLECENADDFQAVHDSQMEIHQPATPAEKDLVDQMIAARWRIIRLQSIESGLLDTEMRRRKRIEQKLETGHVVQLSDAYAEQANDSRAMALASRHESRLNRMYQSSYKVLRDLQASRLKQSTQPVA